MDLKKIAASIAGMVLVVGVVWALVNREQRQDQAQPNQNTQSTDNEPEGELTPTAKTFISEQLGITFTYEPMPFEAFEITVTERDNKIYVHGTSEQAEQGKVIEVFDKNPSVSLAAGIREQFLKNYATADCFVEEIPQVEEDPRPDSYTFAEISYPPPASADTPFWENGSKCPQPYSKTNAVQFFMMNQEVPDKFVFVQLGQDSITTDGVNRGEDSRYDWSASIRIVE